MINFFATSGDKHGWAIDEDLRLIRSALKGVAKETRISEAHVVHSPFWASLDSHAPEVLARRFVIAHADNPPFFYLTQPAFARAQRIVDLWVARSTEAQAQFEQLNLPSTHIPYAIDEGLFFELPDKIKLKESYGLPRDSYIIGNFHRDSEGADLTTPKYQKSPEMLVQVCKHLIKQNAKIHVLLAGPRRHWIRAALNKAGIPFTCVGKPIPDDDFGVNILPREELNRLYNACDLYLIPSRWEGGPQSAMEAAACRTKVLSIPLGVGRDILARASLFDTASEAASKILDDIAHDSLSATREPQFQSWHGKHTSSAMTSALCSLYGDLENRLSCLKKVDRHLTDSLQDLCHQVTRRVRRRVSNPRVDIVEDGGSRIQNVRRELESMGVTISKTAMVRFAGRVSRPDAWARKVAFQFAEPDFQGEEAIPGACLVVASVQEAVNYRSAGGANPVVVCAGPLPDDEESETPFVVEQGNHQATVAITHAMGAGRPVVYPDDSAYYYQIFHAGISYGLRRPFQEAMAIAKSDVQDFRALACPPKSMRPFLRELLT